MKKLILIGRSESGKSSLISALRHEEMSYRKTQSIDYSSDIIDTPGEYAETSSLGGALALYSCEADIVGLVISATEPYSLFPPCITAQANRPVIGIVTKCDSLFANIDAAKAWLSLCGCREDHGEIFVTSSVTLEGTSQIINYLT